MSIQLKNVDLYTLANFPNVHIFDTKLHSEATIDIKITSIKNISDIGYVNIELLANSKPIGYGSYSFEYTDSNSAEQVAYDFLKTLPEFTVA